MHKIIFFSLIFLLTSCSSASIRPSPHDLASIHLVDRNGFSESISTKDRLSQLQKVNFLSPKPYQKVTRVYHPDEKGNVKAFITSYYENGQPKQYLEVINGRAFGLYQEWHENGQMHLYSVVIGGPSEIDPKSQLEYVFDGVSQAWDDQGNLIAEIPYEKGALSGPSRYYHPSGNLWKEHRFENNVQEGMSKTLLEDGNTLQTAEYHLGLLHGPAKRYWSAERLSADEWFESGKLISGTYLDPEGKLISTITSGKGYRPVFAKDSISELHEYQKGIPAGEVRVFTSSGHLFHSYFIEEGVKHGEERFYHPPKNWEASAPSLKLSIPWYRGKIHGVVKSWYPNGTLESQKEMSNNVKSGLYSAWYDNGNLMMIEEYDQNKLTRGEYYKKGEKIPISHIEDGTGEATLYDGSGNFLQKVKYLSGKPF